MKKLLALVPIVGFFAILILTLNGKGKEYSPTEGSVLFYLSALIQAISISRGALLILDWVV